MDYKIDGERLVLFLQEEISTKNAKKEEDEMLSIIAEHPEKPVVFDASRLRYITSSGLRVLLGIQKLKHDQQGKIDVTEVNRDIIAVFTMTGFTTLMNVIPKLHEVSVEGKEIIGQGQSSTVYRMGGDFIIKLYKKDVPKSKIFQEIEFSRKAFIAGIGYGHPIFDLAGGAFHARYSYFPKRQKVHGMCEADMLRFWDTLLRMYFNVSDEKKLAEIKEMCSAFGLLRGAIFPMKHVQIDPETKAFHVEETRKYLFPRMDWAMEQVHKIEEMF